MLVLFLLVCVLQKPEVTVRKIAEFLGHALTAKQISDIVHQTHFDAMKQDSSVNYSWWDELGMRLPSESQFMRKGRAPVKLQGCSDNCILLFCIHKLATVCKI